MTRPRHPTRLHRYEDLDELALAIAGMVAGFKAPRRRPVSNDQIELWFAATDRYAVRLAICRAVARGTVEIVARSLGSHRRANGAYRYQAPGADR